MCLPCRQSATRCAEDRRDQRGSSARRSPRPCPDAACDPSGLAPSLQEQKLLGRSDGNAGYSAHDHVRARRRDLPSTRRDRLPSRRHGHACGRAHARRPDRQRQPARHGLVGPADGGDPYHPDRGRRGQSVTPGRPEVHSGVLEPGEDRPVLPCVLSRPRGSPLPANGQTTSHPRRGRSRPPFGACSGRCRESILRACGTSPTDCAR